MGNEISEELKQFVRQYITSLEQLEILLLLYQTAERSWTIEEVFKVTQTNLLSVTERLMSLVSSGLAISDGAAHPAFRFNPAAAEFALRLSELQKAYAISKYKVIEIIFSKPHGQAQKFAESFKFKGKV